MNKCSRCGTALEPDMAFCPECGLPVNKIPDRGEQMDPPGGNPDPGRGGPQYAGQDIKGSSYNQRSGYDQGGSQGQRSGHGQRGVPREEKSVPLKTVGIIGAVCAVVVIAAIGAVLWLSKPKQDDSLADSDQIADRTEDQAAQDVKTEDTGKTSVDIVSMDGDSTEKDKDKNKNKEKNSDQVVSVFGDNSAQEPSPGGNTAQAASAGAPQTFSGAREKSSQQAVITAGGQLDLQHMGNLLGNTGATYGTYVLDVTNMQEYDGGNAEAPLPASALIGVPILFTIADGVDKGEINLETPVTFSYTFVNGRGVFKSGDNGRTFPVSQMLSEALLNSDNNALNSLIDFLSLSRINDTCHSYGFSSVDIQRKLMSGSSDLENYISAKDAAMMLNAIYQDNFTGIGKAFLEANFKISSVDSANRGMYPACSSCATFLNLNGITDSRYNEIGLVQNGNETFILSVFTCNGVGTTSASALTDLSTYVVNTLKAQ